MIIPNDPEWREQYLVGRLFGLDHQSARNRAYWATLTPAQLIVCAVLAFSFVGAVAIWFFTLDASSKNSTAADTLGDAPRSDRTTSSQAAPPSVVPYEPAPTSTLSETSPPDPISEPAAEQQSATASTNVAPEAAPATETVQVSAEARAADEVRQRRANVDFCVSQSEKVSAYANDIVWKIRKNSAEFSSTGTITPYAANVAWHTINDLMFAKKEPMRVMMYDGSDRSACTAFVNAWAQDIRSVGAKVLPTGDPALTWRN